MYLASALKNSEVKPVSNPAYICAHLGGTKHCEKLAEPALKKACTENWEKLCAAAPSKAVATQNTVP